MLQAALENFVGALVDKVRLERVKFYPMESLDLAGELRFDIRHQSSWGVLAFSYVKIGYD